MPTLDNVNNIAVEVEPPPEKEPESEPKLEPQPNPAPDKSAPPSPIPTENLSVEGAGIVSKSSIKRNLRIPPVNVRDFVKYMKSKRRVDLRYEWEV